MTESHLLVCQVANLDTSKVLWWGALAARVHVSKLFEASISLQRDYPTFPGFCFPVGAFRMACFLGFFAEVPSSSSALSLSPPAMLSESSRASSSSATPAAASSSACSGSGSAAFLPLFGFAAEALFSPELLRLAFAAAKICAV